MQPFRVLAPAGAAVPLLYDSPHSGREYPPDFGAAAPLEQLRRAEDAHVDGLIDAAPAHGVTVLLALVPRCYIDLNRAADDVDPEMLEDPGPDWSPTVKSERGLGLIRKLVMPGQPVYDRQLTRREVRDRIERVYLPYHDALRRLADGLLARHGRVWHVNWHSMKSVGNAMTPDGPDAVRPDFVVGDLNGTSADAAFTDTAAGLLRELRFTVAVNQPYAGGRIVRVLGDPAAGVHSIQIEINRRLYLDEPHAVKSDRFLGMRADLDRFTRRLAQVARDR
jgi:N-formylglutamate deformylase